MWMNLTMLSPSQTQKELQCIIVYKVQNRQNNLVSTIRVVVTFEEEGSGTILTNRRQKMGDKGVVECQ